MYNVLNFREQAKKLNDITYTDYFFRLMLLARSVFEWSNLPNGIDEKWIERYLFTEGKCMFYHDENLGFMVAGTSGTGQLNQYGEPTTITPIYTNYGIGEIKPYKNYSGGNFDESNKNEKCILIRNNDVMMPTHPTINLYAMRLTEIQRAIDININAQKTPVLIKCTDKQKFSLKQVFNQWNGFEPVIFGDKQLETDGITALKIDAPVVFDKLQLQKHSVWNEVMTFLGIQNANMDKRERLVASEVDANDEQIELSASVMLKSRQKACEQINKLFGLNVSVKLRNIEQIKEIEEGEIID